MEHASDPERSKQPRLGRATCKACRSKKPSWNLSTVTGDSKVARPKLSAFTGDVVVSTRLHMYQRFF